MSFNEESKFPAIDRALAVIKLRFHVVDIPPPPPPHPLTPPVFPVGGPLENNRGHPVDIPQDRPSKLSNLARTKVKLARIEKINQYKKKAILNRVFNLLTKRLNESILKFALKLWKEISSKPTALPESSKISIYKPKLIKTFQVSEAYPSLIRLMPLKYRIQCVKRLGKVKLAQWFDRIRLQRLILRILINNTARASMSNANV